MMIPTALPESRSAQRFQTATVLPEFGGAFKRGASKHNPLLKPSGGRAVREFR